MQRFFLSLVMGLFSQPGTPPAEQAPPATDAPALVQARAEIRPERLGYSQPPVAAAEARRARAQVKHVKEREGDGTTSHRFTFPDGTEVEFRDRPRRSRDQARRERVVSHAGSESAAKEPSATFEAAGRAFGLSPEAVSALRFISRHEGGFDAINTWDRARFSWGFIQFAGGYGFPPALAHFKARRPEVFRTLLGQYGVDVLPGDEGPQPVYVRDADTVLRGNAAEQAYGDSPLVIALFIRAGRAPEAKQCQLEAAIRDYAGPALEDTYNGVRLSNVLRSPQALAMLIDRKVHEGNVSRLEWALEHAWITSNRRNPAEWGQLEGQVLDLAVRDADARANIAELAETAASLLERAAAAAGNGYADRVPSGPSLTGAHEALQQALAEADYRMVVSYRRDKTRSGFASALAATDPATVMTMGSDMSSELRSVAAQVRELVSRFRFEYAIRDRLRNIRASELTGPPSGLLAHR